MVVSPEVKLAQMGESLPELPAPLFNYLPYRIVGDFLFLSGQGPMHADGSYSTGRVGSGVSIETAAGDARMTGLRLLAAAKFALGELSRVRAVVKLFGMVNADPGFRNHPKVINGCSDLLVEVLGEAGKHARSAVGMGSLPNDMTVEIEAIFQIES